MPPRLSRALLALHPLSPLPSSYLAVGSWAGGSQGPWWPLEREEGEEEGTVPPLPCGEEQMKSAVSRPRGESPQGAPALALPSAQRHSAT